MRLASLHGDEIRASYDIPSLTSSIRAIPGRRYVPARSQRTWMVPATPLSIWRLSKLGFTLTAQLKRFADNGCKRELPPLKIDGLGGTLYPFQEEGIRFLDKHKGRALLAHEMGLGKTVMALGYLQLHPELRPAVIVCPASVKLNWRDEALHWLHNPTIDVLRTTKPRATNGDILIINYDILAYWVGHLRRRGVKIIIADECHYCKSPTANRTKALQLTVRDQRRRVRLIALTGTPVVNRPIECFAVLNLIAPSLLGSRRQFGERYCNLHHNGFCWDYGGASNTAELHNLLTNGGPMLRRCKAEVLKELPPKMRSYVPITMSPDGKRNYAKAKDHFLQWLRENKGRDAVDRAKRALALTHMVTLTHLAAQGKMKEVVSWISDQLLSGNKLIVFAVHRDIVDQLCAAFPKISVKVNGTTPDKDRRAFVQRFQTDPSCTLFVGSIGAAAEGITLTAASAAAFVELPVVPGKLAQAEDRCHRIGQKDAVNIYYLLAEDTIDRRLAELLDGKRKVIDAVTDGSTPTGSDLLTELIASLRQPSRLAIPSAEGD